MCSVDLLTLTPSLEGSNPSSSVPVTLAKSRFVTNLDFFIVVHFRVLQCSTKFAEFFIQAIGNVALGGYINMRV